MAEFELKIYRRDIIALIENIQINNPAADIDLVHRAYQLAEQSHMNVKRLSGEPYIIHPLEVAIILANLKMDSTTIAAALLHDIVEDTGTTLEAIRTNFGEDIAQLVDGVTKISSIKNKSRATAQAETLRKMLMATINDVRVIIIKLADKLHNMRTIMFQPDEKQERIAKETLDIYAPIARRLGMSKICSELEDLAFHVLYNKDYEKISKSIAKRKTEVESYIENVRTVLMQKMSEMKIEANISGRAKHYYSIYRKMLQQDKTFNDIYDIRAIRIITREISDCYGVLGIIHTLWTPIASRFKDYIAVPKSNMYQSLHTTVIGPEGLPLEVQIKTQKMHETAENGIAAHWLYKEKNQLHINEYKNLPLLKDITQWQSELTDSREFIKNLKMNLYEDEIFVFTPKGKIIKLAKGATPIDFAYAIHTEVGNHTTGVKVNNKMVPLKTKLNSGDIVEVITSSKGHPSEAWLKFVISPNSKNKIRASLRKIEKPEKKADADEKPAHKEREGNVTVSFPVPGMHDEQLKVKKLSHHTRFGISIEGASNILIRLSQCCQPIPGDTVLGFITRGRGITVHKTNCPSLKRLKLEKERIVNIVWEKSENSLFPVKLEVHAQDRQNLLKDIADEISLSKTNIIKVEAHLDDRENAVFKFILEVKSNDHLNEIIKRLKKIKNVSNVYKVNEKVVIK